MVAVSGLNHITVAVSDLDRSFKFYVDFLGMIPHARWAKGAYLTAGELWFCLSLDEAKPAEDYTHLAFTIAERDIDEWSRRIDALDIDYWKRNTSEGTSLYILDPDGHQLELHAGSLNSRLDSIRKNPYEGLELDLD